MSIPFASSLTQSHNTAPPLIPFGHGLDGASSLRSPLIPSEERLTSLRCKDLELIARYIPCRRRIIHPDELVYLAGQPFSDLNIVHSGLIKLVNLSADGRQQVVDLRFKGDWLGFDGIAQQRHSCEAVALDVTDIWSFSYASLLASSQTHPGVLAALHKALSQDMTCMQDRLMSCCTLPAQARVAQFLLHWSNSLGQRGLCSDRFKLRLSREEIGSYLGITLESVSRAISYLVRQGVISFDGKGRRDLYILDADALASLTA
ncbi:Crp/Fnr family transcriptional regulator [Aquabacterium sp. CECT 9606]|uniref:Crp/Fnr family transcriptional regulator n=1 Tax=Aquabacterium sp. CECT 9606 TaxID=2845822 RepID=UPI001E441490|nr:Crp/Fnr family transcriptional regulator [Aquabacterium sp. CECT 9606]CAH0351745.1 hypothetical protein AQB9606_02410 [Aquabacterium sp. CECT 9606]